MVDETELKECPIMLKKRFIQDVEVLLSSIQNMGETDRRMSELYGMSVMSARARRLAWCPTTEKAQSCTKGVHIISDSFEQDRVIASIKDPEIKEKVAEKLEEVREAKRELGQMVKATVEETKEIIAEVTGKGKPKKEYPAAIETILSSMCKVNSILDKYKNVKFSKAEYARMREFWVSIMSRIDIDEINANDVHPEEVENGRK